MYEHHFGFTSSPFLLIPDPAFLYPSRQHSMAETILEYGLESQASFCLLTGEIGSGKSLLVSRLLRKLGDGIVVGLINHTHNRFRSIHGWIASALGVQPRDESETAMHQALVEAFIREYAKGRRTLLVIDEAQNLSIELLEELRLLSNVNSEKDLLLQILLVGQPDLRKKLSRPELEQFAQRISVHFHLTALENSETHAYVRHRLRVAGGDPDLFLPEAIDLMHARTRGVPRLINQLCDFALAHAYGQGQTRLDAALVARTLQDPRGGFGLPPALGAGPLTENSPDTAAPHAATPAPVRAVPCLVPIPAPPVPVPGALCVPAMAGAPSEPDVWPYTNIAAPSLTETAAIPLQTFALPETYEAADLPDAAADEPDDDRLWLRDRQALASAGKAYTSRRSRRFALTVAVTLAVIVAGVAGWQAHTSHPTIAAAAAPAIPIQTAPAGMSAAPPPPVAPSSSTPTTPPTAPSPMTTPATAPAKAPLRNARPGATTAQRLASDVEDPLDAGDIAGAEQLPSQANAAEAVVLPAQHELPSAPIASTAVPASATTSTQNDATPEATTPLPAAPSTAGSGDEPKYFAARPISPLGVEYPSDVEGRTEGYVTVEFTIGLDGHASDIAIIDAKPQGVFNRAAIAAVRHGHFDTKGSADHPSERARLKLTFKPG